MACSKLGRGRRLWKAESALTRLDSAETASQPACIASTLSYASECPPVKITSLGEVKALQKDFAATTAPL